MYCIVFMKDLVSTQYLYSEPGTQFSVWGIHISTWLSPTLPWGTKLSCYGIVYRAWNWFQVLVGWFCFLGEHMQQPSELSGDTWQPNSSHLWLILLHSKIWTMFFLTLFFLGNFPSTWGDTSENTSLPDHSNSTSLGLKDGLECTTSSASGIFSGCHSEEITRYKAFFIANAAAVVSIGAPANLVTLLALPYVRLRC